MSRASSLASVEIDVGEESEELPRPEPDTQFRILVAGDFTGGKDIFISSHAHSAVMPR